MTELSESDGDRAVRSSVERANGFGRRVFGEGGIARQIIDGEWAGEFKGSAARDAAALWNALGEHIRFVRAESGSRSAGTDVAPSRNWLQGLPLNRKERYYTGTVLPGLVASDGFAHLDRFLRMSGLDVSIEGRLDEPHQLLFCTEYGFAESVFTPEDRERWGTGLEADTPDVVIAGPDWLVAVEAKMFHNPSRADLNAQMWRQAKVISRWVEVLGLSEERVRHVLLLPEKLAAASAGHGWPVMTWEQVLDQYRVVGPRYWSNVLTTALADYDSLVSTGPAFGKNKDALLTGAEIVDLHASGTLPYDSVGRNGGLTGSVLQNDVSSGAWRTTTYEVKHGGPPNANWFSVADFLAKTARG
ncbi:hypothetical protein [Aeromicrobium duanguangcaii]|uniref:Restriction endonuclease n=1 Tax=Aeromicrobium duanguangcaii TaxID=2968086 RepID=A0ABY5KH10_9ACTN|nr:hypothetical protein [Aeromicrobium duanguangcaii]MCD9153130.1 hypothetical protein [Aeromicrobium duanguangcaii]UUI69769.1 hypothetical protein NP095_06660 [Aeromicrobium duanguangcaii]